MATKSKPNWKVLDPLVPVLEKEGWSLAQIAEDWGMSLATLEGHLTQEGPMAPRRREIDWQRFDELKAQGLPLLHISTQMGIPEATLRQSAQRRDREKADQSTPVQSPVQPMSTGAESRAEQSAETEADELFGEHNSDRVDVHLPVHSPVQTLDTGVDDSAESSAELGIDDHSNHLPVQRPVQQLDTGAVHDSVHIPVQRFERLEGEVQALAHVVRSLMDRMDDVPVHAPVQITTTPPYPKGKSVRWNLWILEPIRDELATMAAERELSPSQLVQELLWKALRQE